MPKKSKTSSKPSHTKSAEPKTSGRTRQRDKARGRNAGTAGQTAAFEDLLEKNSESWKISLNRLKILPDDTYIGLLGEVKTFVAKKVPCVTIEVTALWGTETESACADIPATIWYRLMNLKDPDQNYGQNQLLAELVKLGYDEEQLDEPQMLLPILDDLNESDDTYISFTVKTNTSEKGTFTNYYINGLADSEVLETLGISVG